MYAPTLLLDWHSGISEFNSVVLDEALRIDGSDGDQMFQAILVDSLLQCSSRSRIDKQGRRQSRVGGQEVQAIRSEDILRHGRASGVSSFDDHLDVVDEAWACFSPLDGVDVLRHVVESTFNVNGLVAIWVDGVKSCGQDSLVVKILGSVSRHDEELLSSRLENSILVDFGESWMAIFRCAYDDVGVDDVQSSICMNIVQSFPFVRYSKKREDHLPEAVFEGLQKDRFEGWGG